MAKYGAKTWPMLKYRNVLKRLKSTTKAEEARLIYSINSDTSREYRLDVMTTTKRGLDVLKDPLLNKGTAFTYAERERLRLRGLLPPRVQDMNKQLMRNQNYTEQSTVVDPEDQAEWRDLQLYKDMGALQDRNETLFYRLLMDEFKRLGTLH